MRIWAKQRKAFAEYAENKKIADNDNDGSNKAFNPDEVSPQFQQATVPIEQTTPEKLQKVVDLLKKTGLAKDVKTGQAFWDRLANLTGDERLGSADELKAKQFGIVSKYNPAPNDYNTWIRSENDILTAEEAFKSEYEGSTYPDFTREIW